MHKYLLYIYIYITDIPVHATRTAFLFLALIHHFPVVSNNPSPGDNALVSSCHQEPPPWLPHPPVQGCNTQPGSLPLHFPSAFLKEILPAEPRLVTGDATRSYREVRESTGKNHWNDAMRPQPNWIWMAPIPSKSNSEAKTAKDGSDYSLTQGLR